MKRRSMVALAALAGLAGFEGAGPARGPFPRSYLVVGREGRPTRALAEAIAAAGGTVTRVVPHLGVLAAESPRRDFADALRAYPCVEAVGRNLAVVSPSGASAEFGVRAVGPEVDPLAENPPTSTQDDALFNAQWNLDAIDAPEAWEAGARGSGVRVAVLDTGLNPDHPDLASRVNMALARSFVPGEDVDPRPLPPPPRPFAVAHGTFVAAIVAAADNGIGVIGVAPEAEIVPIKVLSSVTGFGTWDQIVAGIVYAADIDADVINMSLGGRFDRHAWVDDNGTADPSDDVALDAREIQAHVVAVSRATEYAHGRGATIVVAAGNNAKDGDHDEDAVVLPADAPHVIAVSATSPRGWAIDPTTDLDVPTPYTNSGQSAVDLAAPGGYADPGIVGTRTIGGVTQQARFFDLVASALPAGNWGFAGGTSFAAPHVSGVAALVIGANGGSMHPDAVRAALERTSDDLGKAGNDDFYGAGRVNARRAVAR